jgi:hypothetical protein
VAFHFHTVNVKNEADETFLDFLEGDIFKSGLTLATTAQPAIAPLAGMALALTKSIAKRNRNVSVQDCYLGLDFAGTTMGARLAAGDYIAVQIPENLQRVWYWDDWVYDARAGLVVSRADPIAPSRKWQVYLAPARGHGRLSGKARRASAGTSYPDIAAQEG